MRSCHRRCRTRNPRNQPLLTFIDVLIAGNSSGGTVKTRPPKVGEVTNKEDNVLKPATTSLSAPECEGILDHNIILSRQLHDALRFLNEWEV